MGLKSMKAGDGKTSYANNSGLQKVVITKTWSVLDETLKDMFITDNGFPKCMRMADLGCASGPNTLFVVSHFMDTIKHLCKHNSVNDLPQLEVFLNDLPDNDFNNLYKLLPHFCQNNGKEIKKSECFIYGAPGSFYGRLFPSKTLHFAYSSYSVHWLSQVPEGLGKNNKENIHMAMTSPPEVFEAYAKQFQRDFSRFLQLRGDEIVAGGRMVLTFIARRFTYPSPKDGVVKLYTPLVEILVDMVVQEDDLYSFNVPMYPPCLQEVEAIISDEGSFNLDKMEVFQVPWDANEAYGDTIFDKYRSGKLVADCVRAFLEPMLVSQFGSSLDLDLVFDIYADKMADYLSKERPSFFSPVISLTRK